METIWAMVGRIVTESALLIAVLRLVGVPVLLERVKTSLAKEVEVFRQDLGLARTTFDRHLTLLLDYYNRLYGHYRVCHAAANSDLIVHPDREEVDTRKQYLDRIDAFKDQWDADEGKIRLLLPAKVLHCHQVVLSDLNRFTEAVKGASGEDPDHDRQQIEESFDRLDKAVHDLESGLRDYLRTEKLLA